MRQFQVSCPYMEKIDYYFDFLSPYSYLSWQWVKEKSFDFRYYPIVLGRLIHHYGAKGPAEVAPKRNYLFKDCLRFAHLNNISFRVPYRLPFNSLHLLRIALADVAADSQARVIDAIFTALWAQGLDLEDMNVLVEVLNERGLDGPQLVELGSSATARKELKLNQKRALDLKLFGVPSFLVRNELFWGNDSIPHLERFVTGEDRYDNEVWKKFFEIGHFEEER